MHVPTQKDDHPPPSPPTLTTVFPFSLHHLLFCPVSFITGTSRVWVSSPPVLGSSHRRLPTSPASSVFCREIYGVAQQEMRTPHPAVHTRKVIDAWQQASTMRQRVSSFSQRRCWIDSSLRRFIHESGQESMLTLTPLLFLNLPKTCCAAPAAMRNINEHQGVM